MNIYKREGSDYEAHVNILKPNATSLLELGTGYPLTLILIICLYLGVEGPVSFLKAFLKKNNISQERDYLYMKIDY